MHCTKDFFTKCGQIRSFMQICLHFRKNSLMKNLVFCAVPITDIACKVECFWLKFRHVLAIFNNTWRFPCNVCQVILWLILPVTMLFRSSPKVIKEVNFDMGETINRSSHHRHSMKRAALKNFVIVIGKHLCWGLFLIKIQTSCEYCKIFKNTWFDKHLRTAASVLSNNKISSKLKIVYKLKTVNK